ncbi:MAG: DUF3662 domain-containing protein [Actinomycetaceae bacterium]|nr:DUF3662 domain-containing protein [Actinomycetaceae bacterium]
MSVFDKIEATIENSVAKATSALRSQSSSLKPVEILSALKKTMDNKAAILRRDRTVAPNVFDVFLSDDDYARIQQWGLEELARECHEDLMVHGSEQNYIFLGNIKVNFSSSSDVSNGDVKVEAATKRGSVAPVTSNAASHDAPMIEIDRKRYLLTGTVTVIGRGSECDIVVDDTGISRQHLELRITPRGVIATDMGSTNGSFVEGHRITSATLVDGNTLTIGRKTIMFWDGE